MDLRKSKMGNKNTQNYFLLALTEPVSVTYTHTHSHTVTDGDM